MSTFIIAFIIFALAGLGIRHYIKGKGSCHGYQFLEPG